MDPKVTFVVPCYRLAHTLPECVESILAQTYEDFEVLIMDDCSPDNTQQVASSFADPRVRYIRNDPNIGHVSNFNKGIAMARGKYVWLISADDVLRRPYILERYMDVMERHPEVGYACCPAIYLQGGKETETVDYSVVAQQDTLFKGHDFLKLLRDSDRVICVAGMVRKECYARLGAFPLDLPYAGDWYLWCLFALHYDVAYFAEPMVSYRIHEASMNTSLDNGAARSCTEYCVTFHLRIAEKAQQLGAHEIAAMYRDEIVGDYARGLSFGTDEMPSSFRPDDFKESLSKYVQDPEQARQIHARVYAQAGDAHFAHNNRETAAEFYGLALKSNPWLVRVRVKLWLMRSGRLGVFVRYAIAGPVRFLKQKRAFASHRSV